MDKLLREIKYAVRSLVKDKGYAYAVVLTLAVCIGANTATFAIVHSVLLRALPVPEADRILLTSNSYPKAGAPDMGNSSAGDYYDRLREVPAGSCRRAKPSDRSTTRHWSDTEPDIRERRPSGPEPGRCGSFRFRSNPPEPDWSGAG